MDNSTEGHPQQEATTPRLPDLFVRQPSRTEIGRALYLFRNSRLPPQARIFVAVKTRPIERFVAAAAWWPLGQIICFRLAVQGAATMRTEASKLLIAKISECGRDLQLNTTQYADLLADDNEWIEILKENGFTQLRSERFFEISAQQAWTRTMEVFKRYEARIPPGWRTDSIRHHSPETILDFIKPYRLMPPEEVRDRWRADCPHGFALDLSSILFDGAHPIGTFLLHKEHDILCVDVRVVQAGNRLLNSLGNAILLYHTAKRCGPAGIIRRLQFRGGEIEHRETANLALRMGGHELPARHVFAKLL